MLLYCHPGPRSGIHSSEQNQILSRAQNDGLRRSRSGRRRTSLFVLSRPQTPDPFSSRPLSQSRVFALLTKNVDAERRNEEQIFWLWNALRSFEGRLFTLSRAHTPSAGACCHPSPRGDLRSKAFTDRSFFTNNLQRTTYRGSYRPRSGTGIVKRYWPAQADWRRRSLYWRRDVLPAKKGPSFSSLFIGTEVDHLIHEYLFIRWPYTGLRIHISSECNS